MSFSLSPASTMWTITALVLNCMSQPRARFMFAKTPLAVRLSRANPLSALCDVVLSIFCILELRLFRGCSLRRGYDYVTRRDVDADEYDHDPFCTPVVLAGVGFLSLLALLVYVSSAGPVTLTLVTVYLASYVWTALLNENAVRIGPADAGQAAEDEVLEELMGETADFRWLCGVACIGTVFFVLIDLGTFGIVFNNVLSALSDLIFGVSNDAADSERVTDGVAWVDASASFEKILAAQSAQAKRKWLGRERVDLCGKLAYLAFLTMLESALWTLDMREHLPFCSVASGAYSFYALFVFYLYQFKVRASGVESDGFW